MPERLFERLDSIKLRLTELQQEDDKSATEIKPDLFILVKVTGEFDEYLEHINDISFTHKRLVFNSGHIEKKRTFNAARENPSIPRDIHDISTYQHPVPWVPPKEAGGTVVGRRGRW